MKTYITGSNGFIGSHLLKRLEGDIVAIPHQFIQTVELTPFENFYFLSSYGNLINQDDIDGTFKANVGDLLAILEKIGKQKVRSFMYMSTSSVKLRTQTAYSRAKRAAEDVLFAYMEKYDLPFCIVRPFSVTGVGEQAQHLIPTLIDAAFTRKPVSVVASPVHDFIDVEDLVEGMVTLAEHKARGIFELGSGKMHTNLEVLQLVEQITGKKINVSFVDSMRTYDTNEWISTNFKARGYGWIPKVKLSESIVAMVDQYKKEHNVTK